MSTYLTSRAHTRMLCQFVKISLWDGGNNMDVDACVRVVFGGKIGYRRLGLAER